MQNHNRRSEEYTVYQVVHKETKALYALKEIDKKKCKNLANIKREMELLGMLDHPNVIRMVECFEDKKSITVIFEL